MRNLLVVAVVTLASVLWAQPPRPTPPPEPPVKPIISPPFEADRNNTRVDDRIETAVERARSVIKQGRAASPQQIADATADLQSTVPVELVFKRQITQAQIDAFLKAGGRIDKVYTHVSYGWTGEISREAATSLPAVMGESLLGVVQTQDAELHMDEAGRTGRVRPTIWNYGIDGVQTGGNRITVAIIDSGVDGTHSDLTGRMEYWRDWTADNRATAQDVGHHGSHVAGIAVGSGAASPAAAVAINYTDLGRFPETPGSFIPSPIHIPESVPSISMNSTMRWNNGNGVSAKIGHVISNPSKQWATLQVTGGSEVNPQAVSSTGYPNPLSGYINRYSTYPTKHNSASGQPKYAVSTTAAYQGPGDGYNIFRGVAPDSRWAGLKVFMDDGSGTGNDIGEALDDIVARNVVNQIKVANLSLGIIGNPGISSGLRNKANTAANSGIVVVVSAGNDGENGSDATGEVDDPGRAHYAITVASSSDTNQLTAYSSHGFASGDAFSGDEDMKPDIVAPGGSTGFQSNIMSVDSNTADVTDTVGAYYNDFVPNDYYNIQGTSMASPFVAGAVALIIDAMQTAGEIWDFNNGSSLADVLRVKMILLATATETNQPRETGPSTNPVLNRGAKDINEGYGIINPDAAVESILNPPLPGTTAFAADSFGLDVYSRRAWARRLSLAAGAPVSLTLNVPPEGDFDFYIYRSTPNTYGNPQILVSATAAGLGADEIINFTPAVTETAYLVIKKVQGHGAWQLTSPSSVSSWTLY